MFSAKLLAVCSLLVAGSESFKLIQLAQSGVTAGLDAGNNAWKIGTGFGESVFQSKAVLETTAVNAGKNTAQAAITGVHQIVNATLDLAKNVTSKVPVLKPLVGVGAGLANRATNAGFGIVSKGVEDGAGLVNGAIGMANGLGEKAMAIAGNAGEAVFIGGKNVTKQIFDGIMGNSKPTPSPTN